MNIKVLLAAATLALGPVAASAASVTSAGVTGGCANSIVDGSTATINVLDGGTWDATFVGGDMAATCNFDLVNTSTTAVVATVSVATVNQNGLSTAFNSWGFEGGVDLNGVVTSSWDEGEADTRIFNFFIAANSTVSFDWSWGDAYDAALFADPNIDFTVVASPVPVPAGILLMGTALAGLGVMRRRRKAA